MPDDGGHAGMLQLYHAYGGNGAPYVCTPYPYYCTAEIGRGAVVLTSLSCYTGERRKKVAQVRPFVNSADGTNAVVSVEAVSATGVYMGNELVGRQTRS